MSDNAREYTYRFVFDDGRSREFKVRLREPSLRLENAERADLPDWTRLEFQQCPNCPLKPADSPRCPTAVSLVDLVDLFKDCLSTEPAEVTVRSGVRDTSKRMSVQDGLSSLMGLYMATSGCPVLDKMRPMVLTHIPFSTLQETIYRSFSMYLMAQFLRHKKGKPVDWDLKDLVKIYDQINAVNRAFIQRILSIAPRDASLNALVKLDCFAGFAGYSIRNDYFKKLEEVFSSYLND